MQQDLAKTEFKIVPVPGQGQKDFSSMGREQLLAELQSLRESEVGLGIRD
jgi:hypothetical protein